MPTYEYECPQCGVFELVQKISEESLKSCPTCNNSVRRLLSAAPFHLKGSGWYKTDYKSSGGGSGAKKESETKSSGAAESSTSSQESSSKADTAKQPAAGEKSVAGDSKKSPG